MYQSDDDLIQACRKGDSRAWKIVVDKYKRLVFSIPLNYGLSQEDAADITQITFTILFKSLDQLYSNARLAPWLATVARRHSWRLLERYRRESVHSDEDLELGLADLITPDSVNDLEKWGRPSGLTLKKHHAALFVTHLEQPNLAPHALPGDFSAPTVVIG
ncbi:MAG TPA: sigma-70 family RNA polymerase sigma factor [Thiotrichales bacterium]|nr:sigma-70 family RNA polymerase sigma factor [Thiotrichales bacterium]